MVLSYNVQKNRQNNLLLFVIPFIATFITYLKTVCPTVYSGDSGELSLASAVLGIAHPPGYPLLTLMGRAFINLVRINPAHALNILSALLAAGAVGVSALVFRQILFPKSEWGRATSLIIPSLAAILFGFSNSLWATAVGYEVYSLGALLFLLSLYCLLKFLETEHQYLLIASGYFLFLGLTDHLSIAVMALPILYALFSRKVPLRTWMILGSLFLIAISAYLYIPVRSSLNPIADWNHPANFKAFYEHVTAKRYHEYITGIRFDNYGENLWRSIVIIAEQFPLYLAIAGLAGIVLTRRIARTIKIILIAIVLFNLLMAALYDIPDIDQYFLPSIVVSIIGLTSLLIWAFRKLPRATAISTSILAVILMVTTFRNFQPNNQSENKLALIYGMDVLNSVPQNSYLISVGDNANSSIYYLHYVESVRPDLEIYDIVKTVRKLKAKLHETDNTDPDGTALCLKLMASNPDKSYLVKEHLMIRGQPFDYYSMNLTPQGLVYRWGKWPQDKTVWNRLELPTLSSFSSKLEFRGLTMLSNLNLSKGEDLLAAGDTSRAQGYFKAASESAALSEEASIHNSLGVFFRHIHQTQLANDEYTKALNSHHLTAFERANIYVNLGNLRKDGRNFDEAIGLYNKAIEININNTDAKYNLALAIAYQSAYRGRYKDAAISFEAALIYPGADPGIIFNLGSIYDQELGDTAKALSNYRRFVELVPNFPESAIARRRIQELSQ
jgi:tetratricopeptide (TPR) repeat protein